MFTDEGYVKCRYCHSAEYGLKVIIPWSNWQAVSDHVKPCLFTLASQP